VIFCVAGAGSEVRELVVVLARGGVDVRVAVLVTRVGEANRGAVAVVVVLEAVVVVVVLGAVVVVVVLGAVVVVVEATLAVVVVVGGVAMVPVVEVPVFKVPRELVYTRFDNAQLTW
jgi:hypothetical protein